MIIMAKQVDLQGNELKIKESTKTSKSTQYSAQVFSVNISSKNKDKIVELIDEEGPEGVQKYIARKMKVTEKYELKYNEEGEQYQHDLNRLVDHIITKCTE